MWQPRLSVIQATNFWGLISTESGHIPGHGLIRRIDPLPPAMTDGHSGEDRPICRLQGTPADARPS